MKITEKKIFEIEKELINKYFRGLQPREIELVEDDSFIGAAREKLLINRNYLKKCTKAELANLLKHELIHYALPGRGHDKDFLDKAEEVGSTIGDYARNAYIDELKPMGFLEEVVGEDNKSATIYHHKRPQWHLLFEDVSCPIGTRLKMLREYTKLSREEVASEAGISKDMLMEIENAETLEHVEKWWDVDEMTFKPLFDEELIRRVFETIASKYEEET
jgi:DNA-binding XRE family transcriptional regulator